MSEKNLLSGRRSYSYPTTIANGTAVSGVVSWYEFAYGLIHMPSAWTAANIGFQVSSELDGTYLPLYDDAGNPLTGGYEIIFRIYDVEEGETAL